MIHLTLRRVTVVTLLCGFCAVAAPAARCAFQGDAKQLMQEGLDLLRRGEDEKALEKFRAVVGSNPSNEDAWRIWHEVDQAVIMRMLAKGGEFESIARALVSKATPGLGAAKKDPAAIDALVTDAVGSDFAKREAAIAKLAGEHGPYTIQGLVGPMSDAGDDKRVQAMQVAFRMGGMGVPPLVALLSASDPILRRSAVNVLARLKDVRAMAHLALLGESDPDANIKSEARRAAMSMGWAGLEGTASDYLVGEGLSYLRGATEFIRPMDANNIVWEFADGKLADSAVAKSLYGPEMSRRAALKAVEVKNDSSRGLGVLAMANAEARLLASGLGEEDKKAMAEKAAGLREEMRLAGAAAMNTGLTLAIEAGDARLASELLREIAENSTPGTTVPAAVLASMSSKSRVARLQGAVAACQIDPNQASNADVAKLLADAVGEKVQRIVLLVDEMGDRRGALQGGFEGQRWFVAPCDTGVSALARIRRFPGTDLIVISASLKDMAAEQVIDELKADDRTKNIPILVVTDEKGIEGAKTRFGANAKNVIAKYDGAAADAAIEGMPMNPERQRAEDLAAAAARAIAHAPILPESAKEAALAAVTEAAQSRADAVRLPSLRAIQRFGGANQQTALLAVLADGNASVPAKAHACDAFAGIGARGIAVNADGLKALGEALTNADASIREAAAGAIGRAPNLEPAARAKMLGTKAVPFSASGAAAPAPAPNPDAKDAKPADGGSSN
jgi:CheY-like chemotaxis protein